MSRSLASSTFRQTDFTGSCSTSDSPCKRDALFFLANSTFRVYFALSNLRLCDTVLNNVQNANAPMQEFPLADRCTFLYYRGRIALYQRRLPQARNDLRRAFSLCRADSWRNGRYVPRYIPSPPYSMHSSDLMISQSDFDVLDRRLPPSGLFPIGRPLAALQPVRSVHDLDPCSQGALL